VENSRARNRRSLPLLGALACLLAAGLATSVALGAGDVGRATSTGTTAATGTTGTTTSSTTTATSTATTAPESAPSNTAAPTISGTGVDGALLTANPGSWTSSPGSYAFQWLRCDGNGANCAAIAGANAQRYTLRSADVGHRLRVLVAAANRAGTGNASSQPTAVVQPAGSAPANTALPTVAGAAQEGARLIARTGSWSGTQPIAYSYTWQRCDARGGTCVTVVSHSGSPRYALVAADVGHAVRVQVTASNARGNSTATSQPTAAVAAAKTTQAATSVSVASIALPDRLVIDRVSFSPDPASSRGSFTARFHVADLHGTSVQGALVYTIGLPYGWTANAAEQPTDATGWATIAIRLTHAPRRRANLVMFVRARKPGDSVLAGVSTRRLVQEGIVR